MEDAMDCHTCLALKSCYNFWDEVCSPYCAARRVVGSGGVRLGMLPLRQLFLLKIHDDPPLPIAAIDRSHETAVDTTDRTTRARIRLLL